VIPFAQSKFHPAPLDNCQVDVLNHNSLPCSHPWRNLINFGVFASGLPSL
jgi:hypothetical protein